MYTSVNKVHTIYIYKDKVLTIYMHTPINNIHAIYIQRKILVHKKGIHFIDSRENY